MSEVISKNEIEAMDTIAKGKATLMQILLTFL